MRYGNQFANQPTTNVNNQGSDTSTKLHVSLIRDTLHHSHKSAITTLRHHSENSHCALWLQSGCLKINDELIATGQGIDVTANDTIRSQGLFNTVILRFIVSTEPLTNSNTCTVDTIISEVLYSQIINASSNELLLRLDQVDFPPAAVAYRHTHPGPGIRHLVHGGLILNTDHGELTINTGDTWFEGANSAVTATAIKTRPTQFVRLMLLPLEYEGRSTFTLHSQADADKPKLQTNIRHFEKIIVVNGPC